MSIVLPQGSTKLISKDQIDQAITRMAAEIQNYYQSKQVLMLTIMNGGMMLAAPLAQQLDLSLRMDYLHATRYRNETGGEQLDWIARPREALQGRHVLIVDDILDEGHTLAGVQAYCEQQQAASVESAVLVLKQHQRRSVEIQSRFVGLEAEDLYLFGWGMDYRGDLRHLPDIYGLQP